MVTKHQQDEEQKDQLIQLRASLGQWRSKDNAITITEKESPYQDSRTYHVSESRGSYRTPMTYHVTLKEVVAKIRTLQQSGYKLAVPAYPELQQFFRDGRPITAVEIFQDSVLEIESEVDDRTGLEFLMDNWK